MKKMRLTIWMSIFIMAAMASQAKTNYVDASVSGGSANGTNWANAYSQLWQAVGSAAVSDAVWVAQGTYAPTNANDPNATFLLAKTGLRIYGGFTNGMTSLTQRDWTNYPTLLTGEIQNDGLRTNNSTHIITITNANVRNVVLDGLILTNGYADGGAFYGSGQYGGISGIQVLNCTFVDNNGGAAVYEYSGFSPTFSNCMFHGNTMAIHNNNSSPSLYACRLEYNSSVAMRNEWTSAPTLSGCFFGTNTALAGGAMYNYYNSSPSIQTCQFIGNKAGDGGAVYNEAAGTACKPAWSNCLFSMNVATGTANGGGAVYNKSCSPTYTDCQFLGNTATNQGGAVFTYTPNAPNATDTFIRCTFAVNQGANGGGAGYEWNSKGLFMGCTFAANVASNRNGGGVLVEASGAVGTFGNCVLSGNSAGFGGAVYAENGGAITATNCVFCGNQGAGAAAQIQASSGIRSIFKNTMFCGNVSGSSGGGLSLQWSQPYVTVSNCTFVGNAAANYGGAIHMVYLQTSQDVSIVNSIFWGNSATSGGSLLYINNYYATTATVSMAYSDLAGGWNGANVVTAGTYASMVTITNRGGNINRDPQFTPMVTGVWTSAEIQDPVLGQTRFTNANTNWPVNALQGLPLQPNTASACQYLVVTNTPTTVTVWGLVTLGGLTPYAVRDLHLCSTGGRWTPGNVWVKDGIPSPCIDTGDPQSGYTLEPQPNGSRINMGFDGNTSQASKSAPGGTALLFR